MKQCPNCRSNLHQSFMDYDAKIIISSYDCGSYISLNDYLYMTDLCIARERINELVGILKLNGIDHI